VTQTRDSCAAKAGGSSHALSLADGKSASPLLHVMAMPRVWSAGSGVPCRMPNTTGMTAVDMEKTVRLLRVVGASMLISALR
jgi:hypothetical protein